MKVSGFTITTNPIKEQYPIKESILSWLPMLDEMVIIDGGSTDGFIEWIKELNNPKIILYQGDDVKWEEDWVYWRMGYNWGKGFDICDERGADFIIKFDADYVVDNNYLLRERDLEKAIKNKALTVLFHRKNFQVVDRHFIKRRKTLAVNMVAVREKKLNVKWGYDLKNWGLCDEAIIYEFDKDNLKQGTLLSKRSKLCCIDIPVYNYGYCFRDLETAKDLMFRNMRAFQKQRGATVKDKERCFDDYISSCMNAFDKKNQQRISLEEHPKEIRTAISKLTPDKQGYNFWGKVKTAKYYVK